MTVILEPGQDATPRNPRATTTRSSSRRSASPLRAVCGRATDSSSVGACPSYPKSRPSAACSAPRRGAHRPRRAALGPARSGARCPASPGRACADGPSLAVRRHGKYLLLDFDGGETLLSHLGMSGHWLFFPSAPARALAHVHARSRSGTRRALVPGSPPLRLAARRPDRSRLRRIPRSPVSGSDPIAALPAADELTGSRAALEGQREDLPHGSAAPRRDRKHLRERDPPSRGRGPEARGGPTRPGRVGRDRPRDPARAGRAIERMGTTFSSYRTLWNEPGAYGERLLVYDGPTSHADAAVPGSGGSSRASGPRSTVPAARRRGSVGPRRFPRARHLTPDPASFDPLLINAFALFHCPGRRCTLPCRLPLRLTIDVGPRRKTPRGVTCRTMWRVRDLCARSGCRRPS